METACRLSGICTPIQTLSPTVMVIILRHCEKTVSGLYEELCKKGKKIDAILAADDELAVGAIKFLMEKGIKIPEEVSVIGCNNSVLSITCYPELSSIDNKCEVLCVNTVSTLMRVLNRQDASNKIMVMSEYICRSTTREKAKP